MPKISVLTPLYNTEPDQLKEMIESVLAQSFSDFEFLLLNDSPDNTELETQKFCNRATKAFVALAHQMPSSFRNSWSRFTDSVLQRLIPRGVITEVVFTQSNHSRT